MADKETLGEGMSFLLSGVIHAAARSVAQLEERLQESRGSNNTVEEDMKYRKAGVALPPMQFHAMEKKMYTYAAWCEMWFGERAEFVANLWALLTAWRSKEQVSQDIPMDTYTDLVYQIIQDARQYFATITTLDNLGATPPRLPSSGLGSYTTQLRHNLENFGKPLEWMSQKSPAVKNPFAGGGQQK